MTDAAMDIKIRQELTKFRTALGREPSLVIYNQNAFFQMTEHYFEMTHRLFETTYGIPHIVVDMKKDFILVDMQIAANPVIVGITKWESS